MTAPPIPGTRPKKARKPQARSLALREAITTVAVAYDRLSVRQLCSQLAARGVVEKTEPSDKRVGAASAQMRLDGSLDYRAIVDGHRTRRVISAHDGLQQALTDAHDFYRRNYWRDQPTHVEVWGEKDALAGVLHPVCDRDGVPYVATRGFPSITLRYESAQALIGTGKPAVVCSFGDHDASGQRISDNLEAELCGFGAEVTVERVALNPDHFLAHRLPTRPGKASDSRQAAFANLSARPGRRCVTMPRAVHGPPASTDRPDARGSKGKTVPRLITALLIVCTTGLPVADIAQDATPGTALPVTPLAA